MNRETIYESWVPSRGEWSLWARPILFAQMPKEDREPIDRKRIDPWQRIDTSWVGRSDGTVLVVDLPGAESVWMGLALAGQGYRPVPLYNACSGPSEVIPQQQIMAALKAGAEYLESLNLPDDAPPVFLLDAQRMTPTRVLAPGAFDNRWQVFPQDFPSANFLVERNFTRAVLVQQNSRKPAEDLAHILRRWSDASIRIEAKRLIDDASPSPIRVDRPPWYRSIWQRLLAILGLRRAWSGGFGGEIPSASG